MDDLTPLDAPLVSAACFGARLGVLQRLIDELASLERAREHQQLPEFFFEDHDAEYLEPFFNVSEEARGLGGYLAGFVFEGYA